MTDHEALEVLSKCVDRGEMPSFDTVSAVVGLYRTGQLIPVGQSAVERVARALAVADGIQICSDATYALSSYGHRAQAAISAMGVKP